MTYPAPNVSATIEELSKIYGAMEDELAACLSLFLDDSDPKQLAREREGCRTNIGIMQVILVKLIRMLVRRGR
jgi:hypothetical protein